MAIVPLVILGRGFVMDAPGVAPRSSNVPPGTADPVSPPLHLELVAALLVPSAALGFIRIFDDANAVLPLLGASVLSTVIAAVARRARLPVAVSAVISLAVLAVLVSRRFAPGTTRRGIVPTAETLAVLQTVFETGIEAFRELKAPVEALDPFIAAALIACWIMAFLTDWGALRLRLAFEAVLPAGLLFIFSSVLGSGHRQVVSTALFAGTVLLWAITQRSTELRQHGVWLNADRSRGPSDLAVNGLALGSIALAIGLIIGPFLPGVGADQWYSWRNRGDPVRSVISPYVSIKAQLDEQSGVRLFTVRSDRPQYWRLAGLDTYEDERWSTRGSFSEQAGDLPGLLPRAGTTLTVRQTFTIERLDAIWLPAAFAPSTVIESDAPVTWNEDTASLTVDGSRETSNDVSYTLDSVIPLYTPEELRSADGPIPPDIAERYLTLPIDLSPQVASVAQQIAADAATTYDKMLALESHFRAYDYSLDLAPREGDPIEQFLAERVGFCQQFSGTFALMARSLGAPARVAVGFTWGDPVAGDEGLYVVTGRQAHAWPEIWFPELGWVAFEPTPGRGAPDVSYGTARAAQDSLVQPDNPGAPTTTTAPPEGAAGPLGDALDAEPGLGVPELGPGTSTPTSTKSTVPPWLLAVLALTVVYLVSVPLWHQSRRVRRRRRASTPRAQIDAAWANATEAIELATGLVRPPATTRTTWASQLRNDRRVPGDELATLAEVVTRARFDVGYEPTPSDVAAAEQLSRAIAHQVYDRLGWSQRWRAELDPRRLVRPTRRVLAGR